MSSNRPFNLHLDISTSVLAQRICGILSLIFISFILWRVIASERQLGFSVLIIMLGVAFVVIVYRLLCRQLWQRVHIHMLKQSVSLRCQNRAGQWQQVTVRATTDLGWLLLLHVSVGAVEKPQQLVIWRDSLPEADFCQLRALVRTGALFTNEH